MRDRQLDLWMKENVAPVRSPSSSAARKVFAQTIRGGSAQRARGGAVVPVGDRQVRQRGAVVAGQGDGLVQQGQAPD